MMAVISLQKAAQDVLKKCTIQGETVKLPEGQLDRALYNEVKSQLEKIGGKWKGGKVGGFVFEISGDMLADLINEQAEGAGRNLKKEFQFFATPQALAERMARMLSPNQSIPSTAKVLEPSAGDGALVKAFRSVHSDKPKIDCFEPMEANRLKLSLRCSLTPIGRDFLKTLEGDFLNILTGKYDYIIANPPFSNNQDIDHIRAMYKCLKDGGRMVTIASYSWVLGSQKKQIEFREWLDELGAYQEELPALTFKESGTNVPTMLLMIDKVTARESFDADFANDWSEPEGQSWNAPIEPSEGLTAFIDNHVKKELPKNTGMTKLISINSGQLHAALKKAKEVTSKHPTMELLSNILLKVRRTDVQVIATDLMVTMIATIEISNPGDYGWECLLPAEFMTNLCAKLNSEDLVIKVINEDVKREKEMITVQHAELSTVYDNYNLNELDDAKDWPALPEFPEGNSTGIGGDFIAWMNRACELVSKDGLRPAMQKIFMGVGYDGICMAATDAHVLMEKKFENECPGWADLLVSTKIAKALAGFKNTTISWSGTHVAFVSDTMQLIGTLQDETYPNYKAAIPLPGQESDLLKISHAELKGAMEKISLATDTAKVWLKKGGIEMEGYDPNYNRRVKLQLTGKYAGSIETIFFSTATMLRLLKSIEYQQVTLHINTSNKPVLVTSDSDPTWRGFIMPLSVPE